MIVKMFFYGMFAAILAIFLEKGFQQINNAFIASPIVCSFVAVFFGGALIEEFSKYFVVYLGVFKNQELDEPTDLVLYMIISALGFAALENILVLSNYHPILNSVKALEIMSIRFVSATFLHALCSGLIGYFLAFAFLKIKQRKRWFFAGLMISTFLHGAYNWSIMKIDGWQKFIIPFLTLIILACFVSYAFKKLKKMQSTCLIQ